MSRSSITGFGDVALLRVFLVAFGVTVIVALLIAASTSTAAFDPFNPTWDGTSELTDRIEDDPETELVITRGTAPYAAVEANETVAFVIAPEERYGTDDTERVRQFVHDGGTLVVFENVGDAGNDVLTALEAEARVDGRILRDEFEHHRHPTMPLATEVEDHALTAGVEELTLNVASVVEPRNATVLVASSEFGYLVEDADDVVPADDTFGGLPVVTEERIEDGRVVVVSDPSITIDAMITDGDNDELLSNLYSDEETVLLDRSHASGPPPAHVALLTIRESIHLQVGLGVAGIGVIIASVWLGSVRNRRRVRRGRKGYTALEREDRRPILSDGERAAYLRQQYPEWDERRVERIASVVRSIDDRDRE